MVCADIEVDIARGDQDGWCRHKLERQPSFLEMSFCFHIHGLMRVLLGVVFLRG